MSGLWRKTSPIASGYCWVRFVSNPALGPWPAWIEKKYAFVPRADENEIETVACTDLEFWSEPLRPPPQLPLGESSR